MPWLSSVFAALEALGGKPRLLFTFVRGNEIWRLTNSTVPLTISATGMSYTPALITRGRLERNAETRASTVTVSVARTSAIADALREHRMRPMALRIERWQPGSGGDAIPIREAVGDVTNVRLEGGRIVCDLVTAEQRMKQPFPTRLVQRQNAWPTFSSFSGVDETAFSFETTITAIARSKITVAAKAGGTSDGYYDGGQVRVGAIDAFGERMYVRYSVGLDFFINGRPVTGLAIGDTVTLVAGDDKSLITARDTFGSQAVERFLGFDLLPTTDPFQTGLLGEGAVYRNAYGAPPVPPPIDGGSVPGSGITVAPALAETLDGGSVVLTVTDPDSRLVSIERRSNPSGFASEWTGYTSIAPETDGTYILAAAKGSAGYVDIEARITYTDAITGLPVVVTPSWEFTSGFNDVLPLSEGLSLCTASNGPAAVCLDLGSIAGAAMARAYLTMTANRSLFFSTIGVGDVCRVLIDATAGPFTLTLPAGSRVAGVPATSVTVNGIVAYEWVATYAPSFDWTLL